MKIAIPFLAWSGKIALEIEIPDDTDERFRLRAAVEIAVGRKANLSDADLSGANLSAADLSGANLSAADLSAADLRDADLRAADLRAADLSAADLSAADLSAADLRDADLRDAKNVGDFTMPDGLLFSEYLRDVVPALLTAGGKTIEQIVAAGAWECHEWSNCPMAVAFGIVDQQHAPPLLRARVREFVQFFDAGLIPCPAPKVEPPAQP